MKLTTLKSGLQRLPSRLQPAPTPSDKRMTGRRLQGRRLRIWSANPCCAKCGALTAWPNGFELDHEVRLADGGEDTDANSQVLCVEWVDGKKAGCHAEKTNREAAGRLGGE